MQKPTFIIAGCAKAGTTSLHNYLGEHPEVFVSQRKELNYFAYDDPHIHEGWSHLPFPAKTWEEYLANFDGSNAARQVGESSPIYFESLLSAGRIAERLPDCKIIISLRQPADRAWSGYLMAVREGLSPLSSEQMLNPSTRFISGSFYAEKVRRFQQFFPPEQLKFVLFEKLRTDTHGLMRELHEFLGLNEIDFRPETSVHHNKGGVPRSAILNRILKSDMVLKYLSPLMPRGVRRLGKSAIAANETSAPRLSHQLREQMTAMFADDIHKTEKLIGQDLAVWLRPRGAEPG